ncbi:MAG TPA: tetratricopeptide repeat protein [Pyrinomonadaceae bacterium]|nr:tetratricopeptide repeat protein [Pyrinomonadaceae bacterium]
MTAPFSKTLPTKFFVYLSFVFLLASVTGCRRTPKSGSNLNSTVSNVTDPEEARRQAQSLIEKGKELYKNDQDEQAVEAFKQAINQDPNNAEAHLRLGMSYAALDKKTESDDEYKKAIELFKKRIQSDSKDGVAFFYLGEAHSFLHQDEEAARSYRQATKLKPEDEEAFYQLGMAETRLAHYPEAAAAFQKALELDPNDYRATDALENAKEGTQRIKEGKKHAEEMLKKQQENANANGNLNSNSISKNANSAKPTPKRPAAKP